MGAASPASLAQWAIQLAIALAVLTWHLLLIFSACAPGGWRQISAFLLNSTRSRKGRQTKRSPIGGAVGRIGEDRHAVGEVDAAADDQAHAGCLGGLMGADDAGEAVAVCDSERPDAEPGG